MLWRNSQRLRKPKNVQKRQIALTTLHLPDKRAVELCIEGKLFLRKPLQLSQAPHVVPKLLQAFFVNLHVGRLAESGRDNLRSLSPILLTCILLPHTLGFEPCSAFSMFTILDLFSGCGGISRGFQRTGSFATELAVEIEPHFARAFGANIRNSNGGPSRVFCGDIGTLLTDCALRKREFDLAGIGDGDVDVLVGGPPCQGFSRNGVRQYVDETDGARFYDDPRNHLYKCFLSFVALLSPKILFIENVREFLNFGGGKFSSDLLERLDALGYRAAFRKVCAADFGVPQVRHRVIFLAVRKDLKNIPTAEQLFPLPTHQADSEDLFGSPYATVRNAIGDLPSASSQRGDALPYPTNANASLFAQLMRSKSGIVRNHFRRELSQIQVERINAVGTGRMKHIAHALRTKAFYGSAYRRLAWDEPSLTITTWVYHVGSGRFAHPIEDRGLTMREAARLQSFDDDFIFPSLVNPVSRMIGNAVPPLLAQKFAESIAKALTRKNGVASPLLSSCSA